MTLHEKITSHTARVAIIGLGHVGLPLAVAIAKQGFPIIGIDKNKERIDLLTNSKSFSPDVSDEEVQTMLSNSQFSTPEEGRDMVKNSDVVIICVPTPLNAHKTPNLEYIQGASEYIATYLRHNQLIVLESTTYPGCTEEFVQPLLEKNGLRAGKDFYLAFSPERIDPGNKKYPLSQVSKIVGGIDPSSTDVAALFYDQIALCSIKVSSAKTAEMTKLLENIFRLVNISFVNEMKLLCDKMDIDIWEVLEAAKTKPYGFMPFYPGAGIGGECIPLDPFYLSWKAKEYGFNARFIELAGEINDLMPHMVVTRVIWALNNHGKALNGSKVLVIGASYKKNVGDLRESPSIKVMTELVKKKVTLFYHDPFVPSCEISHIPFSSSHLTKELVAMADCVLILVDHSTIDYELISQNAQLVYDTKNAIQEKRENILK